MPSTHSISRAIAWYPQVAISWSTSQQMYPWHPRPPYPLLSAWPPPTSAPSCPPTRSNSRRPSPSPKNNFNPFLLEEWKTRVPRPHLACSSCHPMTVMVWAKSTVAFRWTHSWLKLGWSVSFKLLGKVRLMERGIHMGLRWQVRLWSCEEMCLSLRSPIRSVLTLVGVKLSALHFQQTLKSSVAYQATTSKFKFSKHLPLHLSYSGKCQT